MGVAGGEYQATLIACLRIPACVSLTERHLCEDTRLGVGRPGSLSRRNTEEAVIRRPLRALRRGPSRRSDAYEPEPAH